MQKTLSKAIGLFLLSIASLPLLAQTSNGTTGGYSTGTTGSYSGSTGTNSSDACDPSQLGCSGNFLNNGNGLTGGGNYGTSIGSNYLTGGQNGQNGQTGQQSSAGVYVDNGGFNTNNSNQTPQPLPPQPITDLQRMARESTGILLPIFGQDLFTKPLSTFAPADQIPVTPDYVLGPGDELVLRLWGHTNLNSRLTIDRAGNVYIPQVGTVHVSGQHMSELQPQLQRELSRTYKNFEFSADLGHLRSIQVFVMGEARRPGSYTVSALSTLLNAIFVSGGPTQQGSLRKIEVRRAGKVVATADLYSFLLMGDKSSDIPLQAGDVIFIPFVGSQVALSGAVRHPAIYELNGPASVDDLLKLAGGFTATAAGSRLSIERIENHRDRHAITIALDAAGLSTKLTDGDVLRADSVLRGYRDSVTIRGNLANAGRFPWHPGMRLSEIIPDRESLLTPDYWTARNRLGMPTPLFQPEPPTPPPGSASNGALTNTSNGGSPNNGQPNGVTDPTAASSTATNPNANNAIAAATTPTSAQNITRVIGATGERDQVLPSATEREGQSSLAEQQEFALDRLAATTTHHVDILIPAPEIDWSYATIERLDPNTLRNSLVPFHLGRLVMDHDAAEDKELQPGDVVTIVSQSDIHVSQDEQTKYVRLEGEFGSSGVYSVAPGETLAEVVKRAGGLTKNAYLYGAAFTRESARVLQQQRLDEYVASVEREEERAGAIRALSSSTPFNAISQTADEKELIAQLRRLRSTGRVVLDFKSNSTGEESIPDLTLENGDSFRVPSRPSVISVVGSVYGQNVFMFNGDRRVADYLRLAGKATRTADTAREFLVRADGSVLSKQTVHSGLWSDNFASAAVFPGDTIVVPEKPVKPTVLKNILDYATVFSAFGVGAAAITVLK